MTAPADEGRRALIAGVLCYVVWGLTPALFIFIGRAGASPLDILAHRTVWSAPWAGLLVLMSGRVRQVATVIAHPRRLALLALSAVAIVANWGLFVWAVNNGHNIEAALSYFITPLLNMAAGALFFRERIGRFGQAAIALASLGVALDAVSLGHLPLLSLAIAVIFWIYGLIRKQIAVEADVGLFVECLLMCLPGLGLAVWQHQAGGDIFTRSAPDALLMMATGPATVIPLVLFAWSARRLPLSTLGFLQFIAPTFGFLIGLATGERLSPLGVAAFGFVFAGCGVFMFGAWRAARRLHKAA